jgi:activating signal cointegrator 1
MRAISLWQPWATFVALGLKQFETRSWDTAYRGPLLIHAAKKPIDRDTQELLDYWREKFGQITNDPRTYPLGCLVAKVELVQTYPTKYIHWQQRYQGLQIVIPELEYELGNYDEGRFAWKLDNVEPLKEPIPYKGSQGFFNVWDSVLIYQRKKDVNA